MSDTLTPLEQMAEEEAIRAQRAASQQSKNRRDTLGLRDDLEEVTTWVRNRNQPRQQQRREKDRNRDPNLGREEDGPLVTSYTGPQQESETAEDGQTLLMQTPWTQQAFRTRYGARANIEWAKEHNEELKKNRMTYGVSEPKPGQKATTGTQVAPDRAIGKVEPPVSTPGIPNYTPQQWNINDTLTIQNTLTNQTAIMTGAQYKDQLRLHPEAVSTTKVINVVKNPIALPPHEEGRFVQADVPSTTAQIPSYQSGQIPTTLGTTTPVVQAPSLSTTQPSATVVLEDPVMGRKITIQRKDLPQYMQSPAPGVPSPWRIVEESQRMSNIVSTPTQESIAQETSRAVNIDQKPVYELAQLAIASKGGSPQDVRQEEQRVLQGIGSLLRGEKGYEWVEAYLNDVARIAWARESRAQGRDADPRSAPLDYIEKWKDAFYGSDHSVPLVKDLDQQMIDNAIVRSPTGQPVFDWKQVYGDDGSKGLISRQVGSNDCGPNAFATILRSRGYNANPAAVFEYAKNSGANGRSWHDGQQFTGPYRMAEMLRQEAGLDAETRPLDWSAVDAELNAGRPVALSSGGHYWVTTAYRDTPRGREYYTGSTGAVVGNPEWARPGEIQYGGTPNIMVTARGNVDPNARGVQALGLRPPGPQSTRANLSIATTAAMNQSVNPNQAQGTTVRGLIEDTNPVGQYIPFIDEAATANDVDPLLVAAIAEVESRGDPTATSGKGAGGVMQLMGNTARSLGVQDVYEPRQNIHGGAKYIRQQLDTFNGDLDLALAAYNAGPGAVMTYEGIPPYAETQDYVRKVKMAYQRLQDRRNQRAVGETSR